MGRTANDDRSDSMNPNNDAYWAAANNHSNQMKANNSAYWSSGDEDAYDQYQASPLAASVLPRRVANNTQLESASGTVILVAKVDISEDAKEAYRLMASCALGAIKR